MKVPLNPQWPDDATDQALLLAYRAGDFQAFNSLYAQHSARIYGYLKRRLSSAEEVDEVFQAAFLKLHHSRSKLSADYPFLQTLFVIVRSVLLDHWRKTRSTQERGVEDAGFFDGLPDERSSASPDSESTEAAEEALITQKLAHLPQVQQEAIRLRVFDELSYAEIAQRLNRREPAIRQLVSRGLKRLRAQWGSFG